MEMEDDILEARTEATGAKLTIVAPTNIIAATATSAIPFVLFVIVIVLELATIRYIFLFLVIFCS